MKMQYSPRKMRKGEYVCLVMKDGRKRIWGFVLKRYQKTKNGKRRFREFDFYPITVNEALEYEEPMLADLDDFDLYNCILCKNVLVSDVLYIKRGIPDDYLLLLLTNNDLIKKMATAWLVKIGNGSNANL